MVETNDTERPIADAPWINFKDPSSTALDAVAAEEGFHPLDVEDCRHRNQIAKVFEHEEYAFIVIKTIQFDEEALELDFDDFDMFVKSTGLVTVQEKDAGTLVAARREADAVVLRAAAPLASGARPARRDGG